jgi:hypothetical protein
MIAGACDLAPAVEPTIKVSAETLPWADLSTWRTYRWGQPPIESDAKGKRVGPAVQKMMASLPAGAR